MNQDQKAENKKESSIKERALKNDSKAQLVWIGLGIVAVILIWLISYLLYR